MPMQELTRTPTVTTGVPKQLHLPKLPARCKPALTSSARKRTIAHAGASESKRNDWNSNGWDNNNNNWQRDWDPFDGLGPEELEELAKQNANRYRRPDSDTELRDKWITPLIDWRAIREAVDWDQERTEDSISGEAYTNRLETQVAGKYLARLFGIPILAGLVVSKLCAAPVLNFTLENNPQAFALSEHQKLEAAHAVRMEESRIRMEMMVGRIPELSQEEFFRNIRHYAEEIEEEERHHNEQSLVNAVADSVSWIIFGSIILQPTYERRALRNTIVRVFTGLSDIAKAVLIILVADTLLGYHSEEGWTGLVDLVLGHYGMEPEEVPLVMFVGTVPVIIDVCLKYWIFMGLNKISPGAVVTIKALDRH